MTSGEKKKGCKKAGRARARCKIYRDLGKREVNKAKRLLRVLREQPDNEQVWAAFRRMSVIAVRDAIRKYESITGGPYKVRDTHMTYHDLC